jgi:hypothetical protein
MCLNIFLYLLAYLPEIRFLRRRGANRREGSEGRDAIELALRHLNRIWVQSRRYRIGEPTVVGMETWAGMVLAFDDRQVTEDVMVGCKITNVNTDGLGCDVLVGEVESGEEKRLLIC